MSTPSGMDDKSVLRGVELRLATMIDGLSKSLPPGVTELKAGPVTYKVPDLVKKFHEIEKPWKDARAAKAALTTATQSRDNRAAQDLLADVKAALVVVFGRGSQELLKFGVKP